MKTHQHGAFLSRFLKAQDLSIRQFSTAYGQHASHITRVMRGDDSLSKANLKLIADGLLTHPGRANLNTEAQARSAARALVVHWLRDQLPEGWENEVRILASELASVSELDASTDPLEDALSFFAAASQLYPQVADFLISGKAVMTQPLDVDDILHRASTVRAEATDTTTADHLAEAVRRHAKGQAPTRPAGARNTPAPQGRDASPPGRQGTA